MPDMKELLTYIVQNLVENPDDVQVTETRDDNEMNLEVTVNPGDMGKVIGRQGRIARNIRTLMRAAGQRQGIRVNVDIVD